MHQLAYTTIFGTQCSLNSLITEKAVKSQKRENLTDYWFDIRHYDTSSLADSGLNVITV